LWIWGKNNFGLTSVPGGILGDGTTVAKSSPVSVIGGFTDWCQVSIGAHHAAAIRTNGTLWTWGTNQSGRLGDGTTVCRCSPGSIVGGFTDWCQVSAAVSSVAAIRTNGTLWTWGDNFCGKLGVGDVSDRCSPVSVVGGFTDWCQVSSGYNHVAAVRTNGTLWTWGQNKGCVSFQNFPFGMLGDGTSVDKCSPISIIGGFTDWCQVSAGVCHTAAIRTNGTLWSWGRNDFGQLGTNSTTNQSSPVSVLADRLWTRVSTGENVTIALQS
jgi:alpha-tubulin suppressor-like RCC1 family protein